MTQKQFRDICITSYDTTINWFKDWTKEPKSIVSYIIIQGEYCKDNKQHIQGFIQFNGQKRLDQIKKFFGDNTMHIEKRYGTVEQARDYCKELKNGVWHNYEEYGEITIKEQGKRTDLIELTEQLKQGERLHDIILNNDDNNQKLLALKYYKPLKIIEREIRQDIIKNQLKDDYTNIQWKQWQQDILDLLDQTPDTRKIHWVYDKEGNKGKSYLSKYLQIHKDVYYITGGKQNDILYGYNNQSIIIYDLARTYADNMEHIYTTIENFKNGMYLSTKYETEQRIFKIPHIIIMANFKPDEGKLSNDRWDFKDLDRDTLPKKTEVSPDEKRKQMIRQEREDLDKLIKQAREELDENTDNEEIFIQPKHKTETIINYNRRKNNFINYDTPRYEYNRYTERYWDRYTKEWVKDIEEYDN